MEFEDTKLHEAVRYGDTNLVESALKENLDPNAIGLYQWGPLHEAASNGDLEILSLLLQYKGDPNAKDHLHSSTPVHYACREGHVECLEALLEMGGSYDITNGDGETGLDVAVGKCRELLDKQRTKDFIRASVKEKLGQSENEDKVIRDGTPETKGKDSVSENVNEHRSPTPSVKSNLPTAWDTIEVHDMNIKQDKDAGTGLLQLSFEYNSHTSIMKIRVWQLEDILLPPAEVASITRVSIRSRLLPDKKGDTKRKTEDAKIEDLEKMKTSIVSVKRKTARESFKAIYLPCTFRFTKPLEYKNVTKEMVESKTVHIDVNVKQKYSNKSFTVANLQLPLKEAVRKLRKKRYGLHPCINYTMPDNIHSYDPNDLIIVSEGMYSNKTVSNPNLRATSKQSLKVETENERASSDINLQTVRCHSAESIPSVSLSIPEDEQEENEALQAIAVMDDSPRSSRLSHSNPEIHIVEIHEMDTILPGAAKTDLTEVKVDSSLRKISRSSPNIPVLQVEDLEADSPPKKLNRPMSPPNRLAVPPITYNRRHQQSSSRIKRELPDVENVKKTPNSKSGQEPPKPGKAVPLSAIHSDPALEEVDEKCRTLHHPTGSLHISEPSKSGVAGKKEAVKARIREKRNLMSKDGQHRLLKTFSEKEGIDSLAFEHEEASGTRHVEYGEISEVPTSPVKLTASNFSSALGQKTASGEGKSSKQRSKGGDRSSRSVLPMSELPLAPSHLPKLETVSETRFSRLTPSSHSTPKKSSLRDPTKTQQIPKRLDLSTSRTLETNQDAVCALNFPQSITHGILHTELRRPTSPPQRLSSPEDLNKSRSPSPGSEARVHFLSETEIIEPHYKQTSPARRIRTPVSESGQKRSKTPDRVEIEMSHLQLDTTFQKETTTPEFKLQMFQRTSRDPHPAFDHFIRGQAAGSKQQLDSQEEGMDPFFVPETPTGSPMAGGSSGPSQQPRRLVKGSIQSDKRTELKQGEIMRPVENPSIVRMKQSVL
ncbi:uncharacterized protein LOC110979128 [Acanthaster planci]|uniref:Uncharacterized protein LOC110979128 n=1 Tax=Acanthaster planci TaxID=133434 RepID=A0A8B7YCT7_ACAPL|nr:uncharacterized protein LOC110979128 [Acanthaster planci]